ncbi:MAG: glycosyltransferase family 39 protein [Verrucomicrobiales bacterium]|nr:glycosyltransferase family 39 protein [Verrucomicrobiales bacterium]
MSGAWSSDFGGHADEGAHVVTSVMVRDYLGGGFLEELHPIRYAEAYYEQFPKVAIGHYPPVFYLIASLFLLPFRSPEALLVLMAATSSASGAMLASLAGRILEGKIAPWAIGMGWCLHPLVRTYTSIVMSDLLLVFFCLAALAAFAKFQEHRALRASLAFGLFSALAILTKGYGIVLALVPVFSILLTRDWQLLKNPRLWISAMVVIVLAFPWMWFTRGITAEGMSSGGVLAQLASSVPYYLKLLPRELGWVFSLVFVVALLYFLFDRIGSPEGKSREKGGRFELIAAVGFVASCLLCLLMVPAGLDHRYLLPLFSVSLLLAAWGLQRLVQRILPRFVNGAVLLLVLVLLFETYRPVEKQYTGARESIASILAANTSKEMTNLLVVSNAGGEGALISSAVFQGVDTVKVLRGSQTLAKSDWLGRGYTLSFDDSSGLRSLLSKETVDFVVFDKPAPDSLTPRHWKEFPTYFLQDSMRESVKRIAEYDSLRKNDRNAKFYIYRFNWRVSEGETAR